MKALIIYTDFASAARANAALQRSAEDVDFDTPWNVSPWRLEMLRFSPTAEEALTDAIDAHLIVFAGRSAESLPFWFFTWLEHWAKCRRIDGASLAVIDGRRIGQSASRTAIDIGCFARDHRLSFIRDDLDELEMMPSLEIVIKVASAN